MESTDRAAPEAGIPNGAALAAFLGAGVGAFVLGLFVLAHEAGIYSAPSLYAPAGGLSGRSTFALIVWITTWGILHFRWRTRELRAAPVVAWAVVLTLLGIIATFPPLWALL